MFKITCFLQVPYKQLCKLLKGMHFKDMKGELVWEVDDHQFKICPFSNQGEYSHNHGYRIFFSGSIDGAIFLFDMALGPLKPDVKGIEYETSLGERSQREWIVELIKTDTIQTIDTRGIFKCGSVGIIVIPTTMNFQMRSPHNKKLKLIECLKEIERIRNDIFPKQFDLFSILEEKENAI
ncbi:hypothetical protein [Bacillus sp. SM2101]|uniref:hypothetical protein n=1 Tax=Bacillus sp. SM2101 TaxID=2805366 RepID=UPI001BDEE2E6|nr:hypothetical protein [Bacillus sp. SM2101]